MTDSKINSLIASLQQIKTEGEKNIQKILASDISGLQILYVWMQCAKFRGVETKLVNLPEKLQQIIQRMGLEHCFTGISPEPVTLDLAAPFPVLERTFSERIEQIIWPETQTADAA